MASLSEFYLTTLWSYKPETVKRMIEEMSCMGFDGAEFTYDSEYDWFKVTCPSSQEDAIRMSFDVVARDFEEKAFDGYEDDMLDYNDILKDRFDNEWFSQNQEADSHDGIAEPNEADIHPGALVGSPITDVWDDLDKNNEPYTVEEILQEKDQVLLEKELGVRLEPWLKGKLVRLEGPTRESIDTAFERLRGLLIFRKRLPRLVHISHVVYAENHAKEDAPGFTADIRYLANIDPKLASSTLVDHTLVEQLDETYKMIYRQGCSIRVCLWAPSRNCYVSMFGPKVDVRLRDRTILRRPPTMTFRVAERVEFVGEEAIAAANMVNEWIDRIAPAAHDEPNPVTETRPVAGEREIGGRGDLLDFANGGQASCLGTPDTTISGSLSKRPKPIDSAADPIQAPRQNLAALGIKQDITALNMPTGSRDLELPFTGDDCLVDMFAAVQTSAVGSPVEKVKWGMSPLIPSPAETPRSGSAAPDRQAPGRRGNPTQTLDREPPAPRSDFRHPQSGATERPTGSVKTTSSATGQTTKSVDAGDSVNLRRPSPMQHQHRAVATKSEDERPGQMFVTEEFVDELEGALTRHLSIGPYRRGNVTFRAEFGRIILEEIDPSGLAFNCAETASHGWTKAELLSNLNNDLRENKNILFTKVLSTYAYDIEDMINTKVDGNRLWEDKPKHVRAVYSFHCSLRSEKELSPFIIDIEDNDSGGGFTYTARTAYDAPGAVKQVPVYIHSICRHWDLRVVTSHIQTDDVDAMYGAFAKYLINSLSIQTTTKGGTEIMFAVPVNLPVEVKQVRVLTKWRRHSLDGRSALEVTEVLELATAPYSEGPYSGAAYNTYEAMRSHPWVGKTNKKNRDEGKPARWYEVAVVSLELEALCKQNTRLGVGEKAKWDAKDLGDTGVLSSLYGPALHMVRQMDHVGRLDNNHLSGAYGRLLLQSNKAVTQVPGAMPA
ncbi:uncharacterized protein C8A04DRAFT_33948 [Dichotomopilus funicola]|uniref:Uncharacterized protein n=1 Tax=Dichotomopilus funicola TaxID=1934379 RepID=A0AAN6ZRZ3_9PEZI|nr:hypothetical protein C8A04DRAFT_33948 [Dichotomopilus funicola]